jgi:hypothetical protein
MTLRDERAPIPTTARIVGICAGASSLQEVGAARVDLAEITTRSMIAAIELVTGRVAEQIAFPDHEPLAALHDQIAPRVTRGPAVLVEDVVSEIEGRLAGGATPADVAKTLGLKLITIQKAMREGRIRAPVKKNSLAMPR